MKIGAIERPRLAGSGWEYLELLSGGADWIARTADDVRQLRAAKHGPYAKLSDSEFNEFLGRLEFKRGGVASGYYKPLMSSLTLTEIFEVFELFGMSREYFLRTHEYKCEGGGCSFDFWSFCSSACSDVVIK